MLEVDGDDGHELRFNTTQAMLLLNPNHPHALKPTQLLWNLDDKIM